MLSVTVAIPMYNAAPHLRECLDSVLAQTFRDFELLIVDNGSTDGCVDIVRSYADPRIRLLLNRHDYIGSLNLLLSEARGKYIARMDADDVMVPQRLALQFAYMEAHPDVDLLGGNMVTLGTSDCLYDTSGPCRRVTLQDMLAGCCLVHPTVMFRTATVRAHGLAYEADYIYAEDYRLWMRMLQLDLQLRNLPDVLVRYRFSDGQISHRHADRQAATSQRIRREMRAWQARTEAEVAAEEIAFPPSGNELTLVIPFINEGEEVARTVRSARQYVGDAVDILVVNDHSYDGYDYEADLAGLNVRYVYNRINIGAAASKEKGARLCTTPYFILLDAHMRFYDAAWLTRYLEVLKTDDRRIVCCQTKWLSKKDGVVAEGNKADTRGAFLRFEDVDVLPGIHWGHFRLRGMAPHQVPAVMGATYGASKRYWNHIRGLPPADVPRFVANHARRRPRGPQPCAPHRRPRGHLRHHRAEHPRPAPGRDARAGPPELPVRQPPLLPRRHRRLQGRRREAEAPAQLPVPANLAGPEQCIPGKRQPGIRENRAGVQGGGLAASDAAGAPHALLCGQRA